ncbi:MAG: helix-turn-helix domain-containing protein [Bacteroidota bacterium]
MSKSIHGGNSHEETPLSQTLLSHIDGPALLAELAALRDAIVDLQTKIIPPPEPVPETELVTIDWVAAFLQVSKPTVFDWINKGWLKRYKIGNATRLKRHEVESALIPTRPTLPRKVRKDQQGESYA